MDTQLEPQDTPVSVVIPCYNVAPYVRRAVDSAVAQTALPVEILCVDDGSTDETLDVLQRLEAEHGGLVRVIAGPNGGAPAARNRGLAEAQGTYIQFLDADDEIDPGKLAAQVEIAECAGADFVAGTDRWTKSGPAFKVRQPVSGNPWLALMKGKLGVTTSNLWRRSAVDAAGGWQEGLKSSQETDLMVRLLANGAVVALDPEPRATIHWTPGSISARDRAGKRDRYLKVRSRILTEGERSGALAGTDLDLARAAYFVAVRDLFGFDSDKAVQHYERSLPPKYVPPVSGSNTAPYVWLCRLVGFRRAEHIRRLIRRA